MVPASVDIQRVDLQQELVIRAGDVAVGNARQVLQQNYQKPSHLYGGLVGLSVLFLPGADLAMLAQRNVLPHGKLSHVALGALRTALLVAGLSMILYVTPDLPLLPDHHHLVVTQGGVLQTLLSDQGADVIIAALHVDPNPLRRQRP